MNNLYSVAIIGGGASGLATATELCLNGVKGSEILILERLDRVGKKLNVTGNGQGNVTNAVIEKERYHGDEEFVSEFLPQNPRKTVEDFLRSIGVFLRADSDGKIYPASKQANSVTDAMRNCIDYFGVTVKTGVKVLSVEKNQKPEKSGEKENRFLIKSEAETFTAKNVVFAFGGKSGSQYGTDGSSYSLAQNFGHKITPVFPALLQLTTEREKIRGLKGVKERATVSVFDGDKFVNSFTGDVMFTDYGVSGQAIFNVSGYVAGLKNPVLKISFLPDIDEKTLEKFIAEKLALKFTDKSQILSGFVCKMVGFAVMKTAKSLDAKSLSFALKNFTLRVTGNTGFNCSQVTKGGIDTKDVDPDTLQSKLCSNLYCVGEALNVDGDCGGYNLTFAFISGIKAGKCIAKTVEKT